MKSRVCIAVIFVLSLGLVVEGRLLIENYNDQNSISEKPTIRKSVLKTDEDVEIGMSILQGSKCGKRVTELTNPNTLKKTPQLFEFPWLVLLEYFDGTVKAPGCDGSLITDRYVLTTADCVRSKNETLVSVRLGEFNTMESEDCTGNGENRKCAPQVQEIDVEEAIYHESYDPTSIKFIGDIGLVRLKTKAILTTNVIPICLPITPQSQASQKKWLSIAGWNREDKDTKSNLPFKASVPTFTQKECEGIHIFLDINEKHMCVGENEVMNLYCKGDSGTPMFAMAPYAYGGRFRYVQYGIVSTYGSFCRSVLPHVYVNVTNYLPWIAGNIRD